MSGILVLGEAIADFLPRDPRGTVFDCVLGGSGFNTALALARLGMQPRYVSAISTDALGQRFRTALADEGADLSGLVPSHLPMPVAIVSPAAASHGAMFALHLAGTSHEANVQWPASMPADIAHVHAASFAATTGQGAAPALALLAEAKARGTSSYDPNIRAACLPMQREAVALVEIRIAASTIAKASEDDLGWMYPGLAPDQVLQRWLALGCAIAIVTRGARGALALTRDGFTEVASPHVEIMDTVGAGDTFSAAFLCAMARDGALGLPDFVPEPDRLSRWLAFATRAAAITCTRAGCDPPRFDEI